MQYLIKIDRKSIKKNPHAGSNVYIYSLGRYYKINGIETHQKLTNDEILQLIKNGNIVSIEQPVQYMYSCCNQPEYLYKYENSIIKCDYCKGEFEYNKLINEFDQDYYMKNSCPLCGYTECCEITKEIFDKSMIGE